MAVRSAEVRRTAEAGRSPEARGRPVVVRDGPVREPDRASLGTPMGRADMCMSAIATRFSLSSRRPAERGDRLSTRRRAPITGKVKRGDTRWSSEYSGQSPGLAASIIEDGRLGIRRAAAPIPYRLVASVFAGRPFIRRRSPRYSWTTGPGRGLSTVCSGQNELATERPGWPPATTCRGRRRRGWGRPRSSRGARSRGPRAGWRARTR